MFLQTVPRRCIYMLFLSCFCHAFVRVWLLMPCGHLLGKGWPLGSRLWCLTFQLVSWVRWCLIVSIHNICHLSYFQYSEYELQIFFKILQCFRLKPVYYFCFEDFNIYFASILVYLWVLCYMPFTKYFKLGHDLILLLSCQQRVKVA